MLATLVAMIVHDGGAVDFKCSY